MMHELAASSSCGPSEAATSVSPLLADVVQISAYPREHLGGSEFYAHELARRLAGRGHRVSVITSNVGRWTSSVEDWHGVRIERCAAPGLLLGMSPLTWAIPAMLRSSASVFHVHTHYFLTSLQAGLIAKPLKRKLLLHLHGFDSTGVFGHPGLSRLLRFRDEFFDRTVTRWILDRADAVASVSRRDLDVLEEIYGVDTERLHWVPNAVDVSKFPPRSGGMGEDPVITFIGRLEPTKGADLLPRIVQRLAQAGLHFRLDIAGDGSLRSALESALREFDGRVRFLGSVEHERIPRILSHSDFLLVPSRVEGVPTVCLEALASGVPVLAADVGGIREVVQEGRTGLLCPPGDAEGFAARARYLLDNRTEAARLGRLGPEVVERDYSWAAVLPRVESLYAELCS